MAFGNSYNDEERCVLAGYDNGDVKMFDLRMNKVDRENSFTVTSTPLSPSVQLPLTDVIFQQLNGEAAKRTVCLK